MAASNSDFKLIETLTRSAEVVLRRLIRYLVGKISLVRLQEMVRSIYIEEAEEKLKSENPTKNIALTKLALLTGLDTRTLTKIRNSEGYKKPTYQRKSLMRDSQPIARLIDNWNNHSEFVDSDTGHPRVLDLAGEKDSFERLFSMTVRSRGITQQSMLDRLRENGAVQINPENQTVELLKKSYMPVRSEEQLGAFEVGYSSVAFLMDTIVHNFEVEAQADKLFQRNLWTVRLPLECRFGTREALTQVLTLAEAECRQILSDAEETTDNRNQMTAGVSLFYFEDNVPAGKD